jgi:hypothetical protein
MIPELTLALALMAAELDESRVRAMEFEKHWNTYIRRLFGCEEEGAITRTDQCKPVLGQIDYKAFLKSKDRAKRVFGLTEKGGCEKP